MKRKLKIIARVAKKALKKTTHLTHKNFYKGHSAPEAAYKAVTYPFRHGFRATASHLKREMLRIGDRSNIKHHFPNGLVSGVDVAGIAGWYDANARKVSIVIPSYNDWDVLKPAVDSIHTTCHNKAKYEIIIVDDYCQPEMREKLKTLEGPNTRVIYRKQNGGFATAVNTGLKAVPAKNDAVIFNSDVVAHAGWLEALQYGAYQFGDKKVGIVAPKLLYPDGRIQSAGSYRNTDAPEWFDHYYRFQAADYGPANVPTYVQAATGALLYVTSDFLKKVGIFDRKFPFAFEDVDLCLRGLEAGFKTLYFPAATLTHMESATRAKNKTMSDRERGSIRYFWQKWDKWYNERNVRTKDGKIRVIYVLQTVGWSGGIKMVFEHANRLKKLGFDVEIWSLSDKKPVWPCDVKLRSFKNYNQLVAALEPEEALKVGTWWETLYPVWQASLRHGIAVNFLQEIESWFYPDDPDAQRVVVSCYRKEFKYFTTSSFNLDEIRSFGLDAELIPCGYDAELFKPLADVKREDDVLLGLGRRFFQKNFMFSFRSWKALGEKRPRFWLYGGEPDMKSLDPKITYFNKPSEEEVNKLHNQSSVFVQTSYHEGFCLPVLEAMATGSAIICTDMHGNRDFCHDGKNCIMVPHDDEKALAAAYTKLFSNPALRAKLGKAAIQTAKDYQWDVVIARMAKYYEELATPHSIRKEVDRKYGAKKK